MDKNKIKTTLRWIAVPFAAILSAGLVYAIGLFYSWINGGSLAFQLQHNVSIVSILSFVILQAISSAAFVAGGTICAPSGKKNVSIVLATVVTCFCFVSAILAYKLHSNTWIDWIGLVAIPIGAIIASAGFKDKKDNIREI